MSTSMTKVSNLRADTRPIDADVKVPEAVKRASAAADAAQKAAYPNQNPLVDPTTPATPSDGIVIAPPPAAPTPPVTLGGNATPPIPPATPAPEESWEHKFKSERGRVAALQAQLAQAGDRMTSMETMLSDIQSRAANPAPAQVAPVRLVTEQEQNEFGPEMLDVMGRRATEAISPQLAELRAMMDTLAHKVEGTANTVVKNARSEMLTQLGSAMPEWKEINVRPEFKAWLALPDPYSGATRLSMLLQAFDKNDTSRVLNFFNGFISELAATSPDLVPTSEVPPAPQPARPSLDTLAAPGRARMSAQPNAPAEKQIITTTDIDAFYAAVRRGLYNGRDAEKAALEQELFAAQREGRVRAI